MGVAGKNVPTFHEGNKDGKSQSQGDKDKMKTRSHAELQPAERNHIHGNFSLRLFTGKVSRTF